MYLSQLRLENETPLCQILNFKTQIYIYNIYNSQNVFETKYLIVGIVTKSNREIVAFR